MLMAVTNTACHNRADNSAEKANATRVIREFYTSFENEDIKKISEVMAHDDDMLSFGTGLSEHHSGWKAWEQSHMAQFAQFDDPKILSKNLHVYLSEKGEAAWFADVSDWTLKVQGEAVSISNVRITGVLEKRSGAWKIVQIHASVPQAE